MPLGNKPLPEHDDPFLIHKCFIWLHWVNSLAPGNFELYSRFVIFKRILVIDGWGISCEIAQIWMSLDFTDDQSTMVQVMAWWRQATSHYQSQCWPRSPYGVTRPQWVYWMTFTNFGLCELLMSVYDMNEMFIHANWMFVLLCIFFVSCKNFVVSWMNWKLEAFHVQNCFT